MQVQLQSFNGMFPWYTKTNAKAKKPDAAANKNTVGNEKKANCSLGPQPLVLTYWPRFLKNGALVMTNWPQWVAINAIRGTGRNRKLNFLPGPYSE